MTFFYIQSYSSYSYWTMSMHQANNLRLWNSYCAHELLKIKTNTNPYHIRSQNPKSKIQTNNNTYKFIENKNCIFIPQHHTWSRCRQRYPSSRRGARCNSRRAASTGDSTATPNRIHLCRQILLPDRPIKTENFRSNALSRCAFHNSHTALPKQKP